MTPDGVIPRIRAEAAAQARAASPMEHTADCLEPWKCRPGCCTFALDALRAEVARCDEELRRLGAQWAERNEALRAEVERLRKQARCGHSPWPCNCGYSGGMCG